MYNVYKSNKTTEAFEFLTGAIEICYMQQWVELSYAIAFANTCVNTAQFSCQLNKPHSLKYKYRFTCEQRHRNHFTAITRLLKTKSTLEIKDMYDRQQLTKSIKIYNIDHSNYQESCDIGFY